MAISTEGFITNFHSLTGITIGERRKNLFLLLLETSGDAIDFSSLQPKTSLEENFKVEALIYFKRVPDLLDVLKNENPILINKILNVSSWFIEAAFGEMSGEYLMAQVFPHLSYNSKLKLIYQLSLHMNDTQKADEFFESIMKSYGIYLASKLLPCCSADLIMNCIETNKVEITPRQLLMIIRKYPQLTEDIFEKLNQYNSKLDFGTKYKYVFVYLMQHDDVPLFLKLREKYQVELKLGARASDRFISKQKNSIIQNPKKFYPLLKTTRFGANIKGDDFKEFFQNLFPTSLDTLDEKLETYLSVLLKYIPSDAEKLRLLTTTFKAIHGTEFWNESCFELPRMIKMMTPDEREIWMQTYSRPSEITEEQWISYMKTEVSVPLLKEKISFAFDFNERVKLVNCLVSTCKINDDRMALLDVCRYMLNKHRNDHPNVRYEFYRLLAKEFELEKLGEGNWKYLNDLIELSRLNGERFWPCSEIFQKYIQSRLDQNLPVEDLLLQWTEMEHGIYNIFRTKPSYEKRCLLMFNEMFPSAYKEEELSERLLQYLLALRNWNRRHPNDKISLFINTDAIKCLKSHLEREELAYAEEETVAECILSNYKKSEEFNLFPLCLDRKYYYHGFSKVVNFLLRKNPLILLPHIKKENIVKMFHHCSSKNLYKYYTHLGLPQKISELCLNLINNEGEDTQIKKISVISLSYTMKSEDFLNLPPFLDSSIDVKTTKGQHTYKLQKELLHNLKNVVPPSLTLETVLKFSKGNYLILVRRSLYSVSHNVAEDKLVPFFKHLSECATSIRKHSIFLAFQILTKTNVYDMLAEFMETEKNQSIRKSLFKGIFNFFFRSPDDHSWELIKQSTKLIDIYTLTQYERIPPKYFGKYVLFTWDVLETFGKTSKVIEEGKCRILESMTETTITEMPNEFCEKIMAKYLFKSTQLTNLEKKTHGFVCNYIIYCTSQSEQQERMKSVFIILKDYIKSTWYDLYTMAVGRQIVADFLQNFCSNFLDKKCLKRDVLETIVTFWNDFMKPHEAFDDYLYLQFSLMYLDCLNEKSTIEQIGEKLALLCDSLHHQSCLDMNIFYSTLNMFKPSFLLTNVDSDQDENDLALIEGIVGKSATPSGLVLALYLLPNNEFMVSRMKVKRDQIIEAALKEPDPLVKIRLHHYLRTKK